MRDSLKAVKSNSHWATVMQARDDAGRRHTCATNVRLVLACRVWSCGDYSRHMVYRTVYYNSTMQWVDADGWFDTALCVESWRNAHFCYMYISEKKEKIDSTIYERRSAQNEELQSKSRFEWGAFENHSIRGDAMVCDDHTIVSFRESSMPIIRKCYIRIIQRCWCTKKGRVSIPI